MRLQGSSFDISESAVVLGKAKATNMLALPSLQKRWIDGRIGSEVFNGILQGSTPSPIRLYSFEAAAAVIGAARYCF